MQHALSPVLSSHSGHYTAPIFLHSQYRRMLSPTHHTPGAPNHLSYRLLSDKNVCGTFKGPCWLGTADSLSGHPSLLHSSYGPGSPLWRGNLCCGREGREIHLLYTKRKYLHMHIIRTGVLQDRS